MTFIRKSLNENARRWEQLEEEFDLDILDEAGEEAEAEIAEPEADEEDEEGGEADMEVVKGDDEDVGDEYEEDTDALYKRVQGLLNNDVFNHAAIVERLWGERDATARSKFRKKVEREKTKDGYHYNFTRQELTDILAIVGRAGQEAVTAHEKGRSKKQQGVSDK